MKTLIALIITFVSLSVTSTAQHSIFKKPIENHRHGIVFATNTTLAGSTITFRPGLALGYNYYGDNLNYRTMVGYSRWSVDMNEFMINEFRFNFRNEYEQYINQWFSLGCFFTTDFRYNENFYPSNDPRNVSEVTYALGLGVSPKIYHLWSKYYISLGIDFPIFETGYFQEEGPDPDISNQRTFTEGFDTQLFGSELRAVATFGYRF